MTEQLALVAEAEALLERNDAALAGIWPRAAALLGRQALESALADLWQRKAPGLESCPGRAQLLSLGAYLPDPALAADAYQCWAALSRALHHHPYELAPTSSELKGWLATVRAVIEGTAARTAR